MLKKIYCYNLPLLFSSKKQIHDCKPIAKIAVDKEINHIRATKLASGIHALIIVGESGLVALLQPSRNSQNGYKLDYLNRDTESTWSAAFSTQLSVLVTGSNSHKATCTPLDENISHFKLEGHGHNIPCVDVSSTGEFVVTGSIDATIRVWHIPSQKYVTSWNQKWEGRTGKGEWIWGVRFMPKRYIKIVDNNTQRVFEEHERSEVLANVDTDHMSVEQLFENEDDDDEYEDIEDDEEEEETSEEAESAVDSTPQPTVEALPTGIDAPGDEMIIVASKHHLYLLDAQMNLLDKLYVNPVRIPHNIRAWFRHISRLSLIEVIPELSLLLVASQSDCKVMLIRIIGNEDGTKYKLVPETTVPEYNTIYPIAGFCVEKVTSNDVQSTPSFRVYTLCVDKSMHAFMISGNSKKLDVSEVMI
jgi:WD40 repeat protein